jgi:hypothetical protein
MKCSRELAARFTARTGLSLVEDTTGRGHRGRAVGDVDVLVAAVSLTDDAVIA